MTVCLCELLQMRHLYVVVDCSRSMEDQDLKPNRLTATLKVAPGVHEVSADCHLVTSRHRLLCSVSCSCWRDLWTSTLTRTPSVRWENDQVI